MSHVITPSQTDGMDHEELTNTLCGLIRQEASYSCGDYLGKQHREAHSGLEDNKPQEVGLNADPNAVDASCREKMCEWSYRVCDHFKVPRNIVAVAFSFLDRFVNRCSCDRTAFKLASMTALYMATKVFNGKQLSIVTLAELSRGEFDVSHISEMEMIMLRTLDWKLNPPTVQDFIQYFLTFLPSNCSQTTFIAQRAMFFAELCVYDYDLVGYDRGLLAQAAILNAIEAVLGEDPGITREMQSLLLDALDLFYPSDAMPHTCRLRHPRIMVQNTQRRLWYLFGCSAQSAQEKTSMQLDRSDSLHLKRPQTTIERKAPEPKSPTSVHQVAHISPISVTNESRF